MEKVFYSTSQANVTEEPMNNEGKENQKQRKTLTQEKVDALIRGSFYSFNCKLYYFRVKVKIEDS